MEKQCGNMKFQIWTLPKYGQIVTTPTANSTHQTYYTNYQLKYDNVQLLQNTIINKINSQIKFILNTHYKHHKEQETLDQFEANFCINNAIAELNDNKLLIKF